MGNKLMTTRHYHYHHHNHHLVYELSTAEGDPAAISINRSCSCCESFSRRSSDQNSSFDAGRFGDHENAINPSPANSGSRFQSFGDNYESLEQVAKALSEAGLGPSNLIVGIDFTSSNAWTGKKSFNGRNLHHLGDEDSPNPYEQAISVIGRTLSIFDDDNLIPCFGFGDATTSDQRVFSFNEEDIPCQGFEQVLARYRELVRHVRRAGPTSFAPIIDTAIGIVDQSGGQFHVLMIIADGQVTRSVEIDENQLSPQEQSTLDAIIKASKYPLSIVVVGVGDGPWDQMYECDDGVRTRAFDNVQFVNLTEIMKMNIPTYKKDTNFALHALMEIPNQYKAMVALGLFGKRTGITRTSPVNPPLRNIVSTISSPASTSASSSIVRLFHSLSVKQPTNKKICQLCFENEKAYALGCGHQTCFQCGANVLHCPTCGEVIRSKIKLFE